METAESLQPYVVEDGAAETEEQPEVGSSVGVSPDCDDRPQSEHAESVQPSPNRSQPTSTSPLPSLQLPFSPQHQSSLNLIPSSSDTLRDPIVTSQPTATPQKHSLDDLRQEQPPIRPPSDAMADTQVKEGDQVSWGWSGSKPEGEVTQVKEQGDVTMTTKNDNEVKKAGEPENPALYIERDGHDVVKKASEVEVEESADKKADDKPAEEKKENGEAETGEKRKAEETAEEKKDEEDDAKKQKTDELKENGEAPKKKGRPAKKNGDAPKKEVKKREPKRAATETGEPRRSGRNASK